MLYRPLGKLTDSTSARWDICRLFDSVFEENSGHTGFYFEISVKDFRRLMICQEVTDYYRLGDFRGPSHLSLPTCVIACLDRLRERQSDGKLNIFMGWPLKLVDFEWPPALKSDKGILLDLTNYL